MEYMTASEAAEIANSKHPDKIMDSFIEQVKACAEAGNRQFIWDAGFYIYDTTSFCKTRSYHGKIKDLGYSIDIEQVNHKAEIYKFRITF